MSEASSQERSSAVGSFPGSSDSSPAAEPPVGESDATVISARPPIDKPSAPAGMAPPQDIGKLLEGERLGQFLLEKFVGGGGMGTVFRAQDTTLNRTVAVKVLSRRQSNDEETRRRFHNEAQSAARLDHANIARVFNVGEDRGLRYIVFEFIEGINLRDLVEQDGPLALDQALSYTLQVAEALEHASQRDVIHRDIKPSNVLITPEGRAKLVDMGLARLHQVEHSHGDLTASGVTLGTFDYISPEQARDPRSADVRSDLYSLGCSIYFMLTGEPPFPDGTVLQKLLQHQGETPPEVREKRPDLPPDVSRILRRLLDKNPDQRYQDPRELIVDLSALGDEFGVASMMSGAIPLAPPPEPAGVEWRKHIPWLVPLVALVLIVLALDYHWSEAESSGEAPEFVLPVQETSPSPDGAAPSNLTPMGTSAAPISTVDANILSPSKQSLLPPRVETPPDARGPVGVEDRAQAERWKYENWFGSLAGTIYNNVRNRLPASEPAPTYDRASAETKPSESDSRVLIVADHDAGTNSFASLEAATAAARPGDVIELRFNGRRPQRPFTLTGKNLTLRPGEHYRPIVAFKPGALELAKTRSMITIVGGKLTLQNLPIELDISRELRNEAWTLFELRQCELAKLDRCSLTFINPSSAQAGQDAAGAFFETAAPFGVDPTAVADRGPRAESAVAIELTDCVVRGEATLLKTSDWQSVRLAWNNGLFVSGQRVLSVAGSSAASQRGALVKLDLKRLIVRVRNGVALMIASEEAPYLPQVEIACSQSILIGGASAPMLEQWGTEEPTALRRRLHWVGDHNYYEGFSAFWSVASYAPGASAAATIGFADAGAAGVQDNDLAHRDVIGWRDEPALDRPSHDQTPYDYLLPDSMGVRDVNAGCRFDSLPTLPLAETVKSSAGPATRTEAPVFRDED